jgi:hypothetical protein
MHSANDIVQVRELIDTIAARYYVPAAAYPGEAKQVNKIQDLCSGG